MHQEVAILKFNEVQPLGHSELCSCTLCHNCLMPDSGVLSFNLIHILSIIFNAMIMSRIVRLKISSRTVIKETVSSRISIYDYI
jgi:hypothetical protein